MLRYVMLLFLWPIMAYAAPTPLSFLEDQLITTQRQLAAIEARLGAQQQGVQQVQGQAEAATRTLLRAQSYPPAFWQLQSLLGSKANPGLISYVARQQATDVTRLQSGYATLFALYGAAQNKQAQLLALRTTIATTEGHASRKQRATLANAGIDASALAVRLAKVLGEVPPSVTTPPPFAPEPIKPAPAPTKIAKPKPKKTIVAAPPVTPPTTAPATLPELRPATDLPQLATLAMTDTPTTATDPEPTTTRRSPLNGPVLVGFKQGVGAEAEGVVLGGRVGAKVQSPLAGKVLFAGEFRSFGSLVILQGIDGHDELLGGLDALFVEAGQRVRIGQAVGDLGPRERLYWEVRLKNGSVRNPLNYK